MADPPPPYTRSMTLPSPLSLSDHLAPPPSYSRARELSESEDTFLPPEMFTMDEIEEVELEDVDEEVTLRPSIDNQLNLQCGEPNNLLCVNCLHSLA